MSPWFFSCPSSMRAADLHACVISRRILGASSKKACTRHVRGTASIHIRGLKRSCVLRGGMGFPAPSPAAAAGRRMTVAALADGFFIGSNCRSAAAGFLSTRGWRPPPSADAGRFMCIGLSPRAVSAAAVNRARLSSSRTGSGFQLASCCSAIAGSSALASAESALPVAPESVGPSVSASGMLRAASAVPALSEGAAGWSEAPCLKGGSGQCSAGMACNIDCKRFACGSMIWILGCCCSGCPPRSCCSRAPKTFRPCAAVAAGPAAGANEEWLRERCVVRHGTILAPLSSSIMPPGVCGGTAGSSLKA